MSRNIGYAVFVVTVLAVLGKVLGFVRDMVFAAYFGISPEMDALVMAELFPGAIGDLVVYCLPAVFLPIYRTYLEQKGQAAAADLANKLVGIVLVVTCTVSALYFFFPGAIIAMIAPGAASAKIELAVGLSRVLFPITVLYGLLGFALSILQANHHYRLLVLSSFPLNLTSILIVVVLGKHYGIYAGALAMLSGLFIQVLFLWIILVRSGYRPKFVLALDPGIRQMLRLAVPVIITVGVTTASPYIDRYFASNLADGSMSALTYATRINSAFAGIFVASLITVMFPNFSEKIASGDIQVFQNQFLLSVRSLMFVTIPLVVFMFLFSTPIVEILLERGAFGVQATTATSFALMFFSLGLIGTSFNELLSKAYYANLNMVVPSLIAVSMLVIKIGLSIVLARYLMHGGLALATSISVSFGALCLMTHFVKRYNIATGDKSLFCNGLKVLSASLAAGTAAFLIFSLLPGIVFSNIDKLLARVLLLSISLIAGGVLYFAVTYLLKCDEPAMFLGLIRSRFARIRHG